jgi:hypothetical protein
MAFPKPEGVMRDVRLGQGPDGLLRPMESRDKVLLTSGVALPGGSTA